MSEVLGPEERSGRFAATGGLGERGDHQQVDVLEVVVWECEDGHARALAVGKELGVLDAKLPPVGHIDDEGDEGAAFVQLGERFRGHVEE